MMRDSLDTSIDAGGVGAPTAPSKIVASYEGVEVSTMPAVEALSRGWRIAFLLLAGAGAWALIFGLIALFR